MGTTERQNEEIARRLYAALDDHDQAAFMDIVADEIAVNGGRVVSNEALWQNFLEEFIAPFPDFSEHVEHVIAEDDWVAVRWRYAGTHKTGELLGIPPTGKAVEGTGNTHLRIEDGEIVEMLVEYDRNAIFRTLDVLPESMYEMKLHRQLLDVLFRILRHNIRNDLNTITGLAQLIADEQAPGPEYAERIQATAESLMATAEKARDLEQSVVTVRRREPLNVPELVGTVLADQRQRYPDAELMVSLGLDDGAITSNRALLSVVLEEAIENAVIHTEKPNPTIELAVRPADPEEYAVTVAVADNGPGIPDHELEPLESEGEDPLTHGSGIGLWVIKWGVEQLDGEVEFADNDPRGSVVRVHLPDRE